MSDEWLFKALQASKKAVEIIRKAYGQGVSVYGETCIHYLILNEEVFDKLNFEGAKYVCTPPIRPKSDVDYLWEAIDRGSYFQ